MNIFKGKSLFDGYNPVMTEQLLTESSQNDISKEILKNRFQEIGIFEAEQLIAITNTESKKQLLADTLGLGLDFIQSLINKSKSELTEKADFYLRQGYQRTLGLKLVEDIGLITEQFKNKDFEIVATGNTTLDEKSEQVSILLDNHLLNSNNISFLDFIPFVRDQASHPTCAAFAATASNEFRLTYLVHNSYKGYINLSESSIFCEAKKNDGIPYEEGTSLISIANVIGQVGQAQSTLYPYESYNPNLCSNHYFRQTINSSDLANQKAGIISVNPKSIKALKSAIENKHLPYIGVELFESIWNARTNENGFINIPLKGEMSQGGHAICLIGYFDDPSLPGGGAFIFKNSWGLSWSFDNIFNRPGFGIISYSYIQSYCSQAFLTI